MLDVHCGVPSILNAHVRTHRISNSTLAREQRREMEEGMVEFVSHNGNHFADELVHHTS